MPDTGRRTSIATVCLSGTLEDKLDAAVAAGFDGVEIFENDLLASHLSPPQIRGRCADLGLSIDLYQPFRDLDADNEDVFAANVRRAEHKFALMQQLGAKTLLVCSAASDTAVTDNDRLAEQLHQLAERAHDRGLRLAFEALAWGRFVNTFEHARDIVAAVDHPALGLCLDSFHMLSRGCDPAAIGATGSEKLFFVQLADAPRMDMDVLQWSRHYRLFPGQGGFALADFLAHVDAGGYGGPLSLEVFNDVFRQADPRPAAVDAMRSLLSLQEECAFHDHSRGGETILPPPPATDRYAFTELGVDERSGTRARRTLASMGFAHVGQHRSKPVELWQQGDARILLNSATPENGPVREDHAAITALAVDTPHPNAAGRRAHALLAPPLPRDVQTGEADLVAVDTPDGTSLFFCRTDSDEGWLTDFIPTGDASAGAGLVGLDHVALTQPFDHFDEAALFYHSILGLHSTENSEFAAPFGVVRSRGLSSEHGEVRIALNVTLLRRGEWAPGVSMPQHVAFSTNDIIATAHSMHDHGAPILSIPDNYYDDLAARSDLDAGLLAEMREHSVLYDWDSAGELFHFYTRMLGSHVFLEVVQRTGSYSGYGANNAPIRMAAHRHDRLSSDNTPS